MENFVEVKNIVKKYKGFTLDNVSFSIPYNSIVGFIGGNGSGKSTTMKAILNLINLDSGEIDIFDKNYKELSKDERERIGVVLDEICLPEKIKISNLNKIFKGIFKRWDSKSFFEYLTKFNINSNLTTKELSKGMKVKLNLAIAFSRNAELLILDEPVNGLDPMSRDEIDDILINFVHQNKNSIFISSHIINELEKICDYIVFINDGKIMFNEKKSELLDMFLLLSVKKEDFDNIDKNKVIRYKELYSKYLVLIKNDRTKYEDMIDITLEDIMVMFTRGKML